MHIIEAIMIMEVKSVLNTKLRKENYNALSKIQKIMTLEEGVEISKGEVLQRILEFYGKFVPYERTE